MLSPGFGFYRFSKGFGSFWFHGIRIFSFQDHWIVLVSSDSDSLVFRTTGLLRVDQLIIVVQRLKNVTAVGTLFDQPAVLFG